MGMVIDLTKTNRFYDKDEMKKNNISHVKLECQGYRHMWTNHCMTINNVHCVFSHF